MRNIVLSVSLVAAMLFLLAHASTAQAQVQTTGGYHHQGLNPAYADYIADCVDHLPRWGVRHPCRRHQGGRSRVYSPNNINSGYGSLRSGSYSGHAEAMQLQTGSYSIRKCHDWVLRNGLKVYTGPEYAC